MADRFDVAVVGSGFAGSILARALASAGRRVALVERARHPRFALGESSTPLAAIALERLAHAHDMPDLLDLASYGRWLRRHPELRRGLKRGFTFYPHRAGEPYANGPRNEARLLVAASPDDEVADSHWLRADVDVELVRRAVAVGVDYRDRTELREAEISAAGVRLRGSREGDPLSIASEFVVDATGGADFLARHLELPSRLDRVPFASRLVAAHFEGVRPFAEVAAAAGAELPSGPYPDDLAAVHHLTDLGWLYALRFDHGVTSAGFVVDSARATRLGFDFDAGDPAGTWHRLLERYPSLRGQFAGAGPRGAIAVTPRLQRRLGAAAGPRWALLPHSFAFFDPLFSTGIAWSLLGVERLAALLADGLPDVAGLRAYETLLADEAEHLQALLASAYRRFEDFGAFTSVALVYFAAASFNEVRQRLLPPPEGLPSWAWDGFLGARDPLLQRLARDAATAGPDSSRSIRDAIAPRNVAGLADPARHNLYPVDLDELVRYAGLLGMTAAEMTAALPRLRGRTSRRVVAG